MITTPGITNNSMQPKLPRPLHLRLRLLTSMTLLAAACSTAQAEQSEFKLGMSSTLTYSDNVKLSSTNKQSGTTLRVEPTLSWHRDAAVFKTDIDLGVAFYTSSASQSNSTQVRLNGDVQGNFLNKTLLLDVSSRVAEQSTSVFNQPTPNGQADTTNSLTQTRYLSAGATYRNRAFTDWNYDLNYRTAYSEDSKNILADTHTQTVAASLGNQAGQKTFFTVLSANGNYYEPKNLTSYKTGQAQLQLGFRPWTELTTFVSGGQEYNGYRSEDRNSTIYDAGFNWAPNKRAAMSASFGHRFYGQSHAVSLSYTTPKTIWRFSSSKTATHVQNQLSLPAGFIYFQLLQSGNQTLIDEFKNQYGSYNLLDPINFLSDSYTLNRTTQLTASFLGVRNVLTVTAFRQNTSALSGSFAGVVSLNNFGSEIRQDGSSINWNHKLDQRNSFGAGFIWLHSRALSGTNDITTRTTNLNYQYRINKKTSSGLTLRHYQSSSITNADVTENAIVGTIRTEF